jgi:uncharacterized protein (DUF2141 family)
VCATLIAAAWPLAIIAEARVARLVVTVTGIDVIQDDLAIAVFDSAASFDARADAVAAGRLPIVEQSATWSVELEAPARYAVVLFQDLNGNGEIDMRRFGRPAEPYGFSNDVRGRFGPPSFEDAVFEFDAEGLAIEIGID